MLASILKYFSKGPKTESFWFFSMPGRPRRKFHSTYGASVKSSERHRGGLVSLSGYKVLALLQMPLADKEPVDQADVYVHVTMIKKWDICAGAALLSAHGNLFNSPSPRLQICPSRPGEKPDPPT